MGEEGFGVPSDVSAVRLTGQAQAIRHGLSTALQGLKPELRKVLKKADLLSRDARAVESKKAGKVKARKSAQWVKR